MTKILLLATSRHQEWTKATHQVVMAARHFGAPIAALVVGEGPLPTAGLPGVDAYWQLPAPLSPCATWPAEALAPVMAALVAHHHYTHILAPVDTTSKDLLPRVAALLDWPMVSDVTTLLDCSPEVATFVRPCYAGNIEETVQVTSPTMIMTVRASRFASPPAPESTEPPPAPLYEALPAVFMAEARWNLSQPQAPMVTPSLRPDLTTARVVVSGGRGLKEAKNFRLIEALADALGGAVGASRAVVDAGFVPNELQVGQTGKVVAPDLYIAVGLSGAIQHMAGMRDSRVIVAINTDPSAPIMEAADYALEADLFEAVPELIEHLNQRHPQDASQDPTRYGDWSAPNGRCIDF